MKPEPELEHEKILGVAPSHPLPPSSALEHSREAALAAFRQANLANKYRSPRMLLLAALLVVSGFITAIYFRAQPFQASPEARTLLATRDAHELLSQGQGLFGDTIEAVIVMPDDTDFVLSKNERKSNAPFFLIHFKNPVTNLPISVIGFSGSLFNIAPDDEIEILEANDGRFIIAGKDYIIETNSAHPISAAQMTL